MVCVPVLTPVSVQELELELEPEPAPVHQVKEQTSSLHPPHVRLQ